MYEEVFVCVCARPFDMFQIIADFIAQRILNLVLYNID